MLEEGMRELKGKMLGEWRGVGEVEREGRARRGRRAKWVRGGTAGEVGVTANRRQGAL
jgi:hypothetical protein